MITAQLVVYKCPYLLTYFLRCGPLMNYCAVRLPMRLRQRLVWPCGHEEAGSECGRAAAPADEMKFRPAAPLSNQHNTPLIIHW